MVNLDKKRMLQYKIFNGLTPEELDKVLKCCTETSYGPGDAIIRESVMGTKIYLVLKGQTNVEIEYEGMEGANRLTTLKEGNFFGEYCFLERKPRTAKVCAIDEVDVLKMDNDLLDKLFEKDNHIGYVMIRNLATELSQRLYATNIKLRDKAA